VKTIKLDSKVFTYEIKRSKRKTIALRVVSKGTIKISAPLMISVKTIEDIIREKTSWILDNAKKQEEIEARFRNRNKILFLGKEYCIEREINKDKTFDFKIDGEIFKIIFPRVLEEQEEKELLMRWMKNESRKILKARTDFYCKLLELSYNEIHIKDQKTLWGSCSSKDNINYNYRIIMAPIEIVDYLVVHEACHLVHRDHGKAYWNLVGSVIPDYKERRAWLKNNGLLLKI